MTGFYDPGHQQQTRKWNGANPKKRPHGGCQSVNTHRRDAAYNEGTDGGNNASGVIAKPGTGRSEAGWKEFRKIVGERTEDAEDGETNKEITVEAVVRWKIESESQHDRQSGQQKIDDVHGFASQLFREWNCQQRPDQTAKIENIRSQFDPLLNQLLSRNGSKTLQLRFFVA